MGSGAGSGCSPWWPSLAAEGPKPQGVAIGVPRACSHAAVINKGTPDRFAAACPLLCLERKWTVATSGA